MHSLSLCDDVFADEKMDSEVLFHLMVLDCDMLDLSITTGIVPPEDRDRQHAELRLYKELVDLLAQVLRSLEHSNWDAEK